MKNKAINDLKTDTVDSLKNSKNKLPSYLAVGGMVLGSTFAGLTSANAANVGGGITHKSATTTAYIFDIANKDLTVTTNNSANPKVTTVATGAISDNATRGDLIVTSGATDVTGMIATIASVILDAGGTVGVQAIIDVDEAAGDMTVTFSGAYSIDGGLTITTLENEDSETLTVNFDGATEFTLISNLVVSDDITGSINAVFSAAAIFTAGLDLKDSASDGTSTITFDGAGTQAVAGAIDGQADNMGTIAVTNTAGLVSFAGAIGGNNDIKNINIGSTSDEAQADFAAAVNANTITVQGGEAATEDSLASFDAAVTGAIVLNPGTLGDATADFMDVNAIIALTSTITTTATDSELSFVRVYDAGGGAAAVQTFSGAIGTTANRIGTLQVGGVETDGGSGNFNADVAVTNLNIAAGVESSELSLGAFAGNVNATTVTLTDADATINATLELDGASVKTLSGTVDGGVANTGTLKISGAGKVVAGVVGGIQPLRMLDLDALTTFNSNASALGLNLAAGILSHVKGDLTVGATNIVLTDATAQLFISGTGDQTITGELTGGTAETGIVDVTNSGGTVTFATKLGDTQELAEVELNAGSNSIFNSTVETGILDMVGTAAATFTTKNNVANQITLAATATLIIDDSIVTTDELFTVGAEQTDNDIAGTDNIKMPVNLDNGQTVVLLAGTTDAADAAIMADVQTAVMDTALKTYTVSVTEASADNDIVITASDRTAASVGTELGATTDVGTAFLQAVQAATNDSVADADAEDGFANVLNAINGFSTTDDTALALQVAPQEDTIGGSAVATNAMTGTVQGIVSNRMASLRSGDAFVTGMSAGNGMSANSGFIQAFGSEGEQKNTTSSGGTVYGFDAETSGVAIGFDGMTDDGSTVGLSASYSSTDVDGKGTGKSTNAIDSYTVSAYADKATENGYIEGSLTYGINENSTSRLVNTAGLNRSYSADYDSNQISLKVGGGVPQEVRDGTFVTPFMSATATSINTDAYTEKSNTTNDALRLRVEQDDINSLVGSVGVKAHMVTDSGTPMISLAVNNEFGDSSISTQNTYQGGGTKFKTTHEVEELSATLGLGFSFGNDVTSLNINYEANVNDDEYVNQYGSIKIVAKF
ncbi:autotransporter outer membrane beta-barrel domain-containing protein [Candidatus Pelagibacter sp.]|nr:autotransporter outer membrane beta-barrel domain-containing protein [Candidatus Pelagibacter sp.]